jgi:MoaA/NifB/PqqE/SkfB family radical SAM enzyme
MNIVKVESNKPANILRIELFLSNLCNYKCWYCFPGSNEGTHTWPDVNLVCANLSHLLDYYKNNLGKTKFYIHVIGGEPTMWSKFDVFVNYFKEKYNCIITMSSNGSRTIRWWEEHGHNFDEVLLSCHHEQVDINHYINVANTLYKKNVWATASVLMDPFAWDKCVSLVETLKKASIGWSVTTIEAYHHSIAYTADQKKYLLKNLKKLPNVFYYLKNKKLNHNNSTIYFENGRKKKVGPTWLSIKGLNKFYGWNCNVGIDTLYIDKNGDVTGACTVNLYDLDFKYNLFDKEFTNKFQPKLIPTTCNQIECRCQPEINCRKEKQTNQKLIPIIRA